MALQLIQVSNDFWNIRGEFKIGGVINIGTHCSLVRLANGKFLFLDALTLDADSKQQVDELTNNGRDIQAILNLHPFHTVHVKGIHAQYPDVPLYGTKRHIERFPDINWQPELVESPECQALFANDLEFSIPAGVDFISANENVHFSSVLALHKASGTLHVDDTLMYLQLPGRLKAVTEKGALRFHITLAKALEPRAGAAQDFRQWATDLAARWHGNENLCAAHSATLLNAAAGGKPLSKRILAALGKTEKILRAHEKKYG